MRLYSNNIIRLLFQSMSLILMLFIVNINERAAISIYNRYPILVIVLSIILLFGIFTKTKFALCCEILSYISLFSLVLYRIVFEMEGFITLNTNLFGFSEYLKFIIGLILFFTILIHYFKTIYSHLVNRNVV